MTPDVNVLVAAFRGDHEHHRPARTWLDRTRASAQIVLLPVVATGFVRTVGQRRAFPVPTPADEAVAFVEALLKAGDARMVAVSNEWPAFARLCREHAPAGGNVTDAWIAASVLLLDEHLATFDRGFRRLLPPHQLTVLDPTAS